MGIPNNEGKACDAVVRFLEELTGETRTNIRRPEKDGVGPPVDLRLKLGVQEYAIEHTLIESFENQVEGSVTFHQINNCIKQKVSDTLPEPAYYQLHLPVEVRLPKRKKKRDQTLDNLVEWVRDSACRMHKRNAKRFIRTLIPSLSDDRIQGTPEGINCPIELLRWPIAVLIRRKPGHLDVLFTDPPALEDLRANRLKHALDKKCPKLKRCKAEKTRTILVLENLDIALSHFAIIGDQLSALLAARADAPDEVYLVETHTNPWWVWPMKHDDVLWTTMGMPRWGQPMYHPDRLPTAGMLKWERDMFQLDQMYVPHPPEWIPTVFEKDELKDLALS